MDAEEKVEIDASGMDWHVTAESMHREINRLRAELVRMHDSYAERLNRCQQRNAELYENKIRLAAEYHRVEADNDQLKTEKGAALAELLNLLTVSGDYANGEIDGWLHTCALDRATEFLGRFAMRDEGGNE
jgi:hypothetical protein